jgi:hypothetical protein
MKIGNAQVRELSPHKRQHDKPLACATQCRGSGGIAVIITAY